MMRDGSTLLFSKRETMKLPVHRTGLPGKELSFDIVPLDPAYKAGLAGHLPAILSGLF